MWCSVGDFDQIGFSNGGYSGTVGSSYQAYQISANSTFTFTIGTDYSFKGGVVTMINSGAVDSRVDLIAGTTTMYTTFFKSGWSESQTIWVPPVSYGSSVTWYIKVYNEDDVSRRAVVSAAM
jgi:hypothetical protein